MPDIATLSVGITGDESQLLASIKRSQSAVQGFADEMNRGLQFGVGLAAGVAAFAGLERGIQAAGQAIVGFSATMEQSQIGFATLLRGQDDWSTAMARSTDLMAQLQQIAKTTPFELPDVVTGTKRLLAMGFSAQEAVPQFINVGNAVSAMGGSSAEISRLTLVLGQMNAATRVNAQDMRQLTELGIPAWKILGDAIGKTEGETRKLSEEGKIASQTMIKAFNEFVQNNWGDAMERQSRTAIGALSNLKDISQTVIAQAFLPLFEAGRDALVGLADFLQAPIFTQWASAFQVGVQASISALGQFVSGFGAVPDELGKVFAALSGGDIQGALDHLGAAFNAVLDGILASVKGFAGGFFEGGISVVTEFANGMLQGGLSLVQQAAEAVAGLVASFLGQSMPTDGPLVNVASGGASVGEAWAGGLRTGLGGVAAIAAEANDALANNAGNMAALKAAAEDADDALRAVNSAIKEISAEQRDLKFEAEDIKSAYEDQIDPLQEALDALRDQNDIAEKMADIQFKIRDIELRRAETAAKGNPVEVARLKAQLDQNKALQDQLRFKDREQSINDQIRDQEERRAEAQKKGKDFDAKSYDTKIAILRAQQQQSQIEEQINGLQDKGALAQIAQQKEILTQDKESYDLNKAIVDINRELVALPLQQQIEALKKQEEERLKPIQQRQDALEREKAIYQDQATQLGEIKAGLADQIQAVKETEKAAKDAAKNISDVTQGGKGLKLVDPSNIQQQKDIADAATNMGRQIAGNIGKGSNEWISANMGKLIGGAIGAAVGSIAFGPIGAIAGGLFGSELGKALQEKIPDFGPLVQAKAEGVLAFIQRLVADVQAGLEGGLPGIVGVLAKWGRELAEWAAPYVKRALDQLGEWKDRLFEFISDNAGAWGQQLATWGGMLWDWIKTNTPIALTWLGNLKDRLFEFVGNNAQAWGSQLALWGVQLWQWITVQASVALAELGKLKDQLFAFVLTNAPRWADQLILWGRELWAWIEKQAPQTLKSLEAWRDDPVFKFFSDNAQSFADQVQTQWGPGLYGWVTSQQTEGSTLDGFNKWRASISQWLDRNSYESSKEFAYQGTLWIGGLIGGVAEKTPAFLLAVGKLATDAINTFAGAANDFIALGVRTVAQIVIGLSDGFSQASRELQDAFVKWLGDALLGALDAVTKLIGPAIINNLRKNLNIPAPSGPQFQTTGYTTGAAQAQAPTGGDRVMSPEEFQRETGISATGGVPDPNTMANMSLQQQAAFWAVYYGLDPNIFVRQLQVESGFDPTAQSPAGASGVAQFMPGTGTAVAGQLGVPPDQFWADTSLQIQGAALHMKELLDTFGTYEKALAAYNAGPGAVQQFGGVPPYAETQRYIQLILGSQGGMQSFVLTNQQLAQALAMLPQPMQAAGQQATYTAEQMATFADQQTQLNALLSQETPGAATSAQAALSQMAAVIPPLMQSVTEGSVSTDQLGLDLVKLASSTGLATQPLADLNAGTISLQQALGYVVDAMAAVNPAFESIVTPANESSDATQRLSNASFATATGILNMLASMNQMPAAVPVVEDAAKAATDVIATTGQTFDATGQQVNSTFSNMNQQTAASMNQMVKNAASSGTGVVQSVGQMSAGTIDQITKMTSQTPPLVEKSADRQIKSAGELQEGFVGSIEEMNTGAVDEVEAMSDEMQKIAEDLSNQMYDLGKDVGNSFDDGLADGIEDSSDRIRHAAERAAESAYDAAMRKLDGKSPSRLMRYVGRDVYGEGFALGIEDSEKRVRGAVSDVLALPSLESVRGGQVLGAGLPATGGGGITINIYPSGAILTPDDMVRQIQDGLIRAGIYNATTGIR